MARWTSPNRWARITLASREKLDNLIFVINCNLQRLDGPVRGNGKVIQELEAAFRGAGWNVIKVIWGGDWDPLLAARHHRPAAEAHGRGAWTANSRPSSGQGRRVHPQHFFGKYPELLDLVAHLSDEQIFKLRRGGHDPKKVYNAYSRRWSTKGAPR